MPVRILKPGPAAWIACAAMCILLIALDILALLAGAGFWVTLAYFLSGCLGLWVCFEVGRGRAAWLKLDSEGFTKRTLLTTHRFAWGEVSPFTVAETWPRIGGFAKKVVMFRRLGDAERDHFSQITDVFDPSKGFSHNYDMEPDHFADLLNDYRQAALLSANRSQEAVKSAEISPQVDD